MTKLFGGNTIWKDRYEIDWCDHCNTATINCPDCKNSSCNGGGCEKCHDDFNFFIKNVKARVEYYLTDDEKIVYSKTVELKKLILESLNKGETEISFVNLHRDGHMSVNTEKLFKDKLLNNIVDSPIEAQKAIEDNFFDLL